MKKYFSIFAVLLMLVAGSAWAADTNIGLNLTGPSTANTTWNNVNSSLAINGVMGPVPNPFTTVNVNTNGVAYNGSLYLANAGNNPYGYGVDSTTTRLQAATNNGEISFTMDRNKSYVPMYGAAGQNVTAFVGSTGVGQMALNGTTNYAALGIGNYSQPNVPGGGQFYASGTYGIVYQNTTPIVGQGASLTLGGIGTSRVNAMSSDIGATSFNFGAGQGCYTNATIASTGLGTMILYGASPNTLNAPGFSISQGGGNLQVNSNFNNGMTLGVTTGGGFSINGN